MSGLGPDAAETFEPHRARLIRIAYRMLGSVADAEDAVQDAFLRWLDTDRAEVAAPEAYLTRIVTRRCLDVLKSAQRRRETYVGPWLPEPVVEAEDEIPDVTLPLLVALERLFRSNVRHSCCTMCSAWTFDDVAASIGRDAPAVRQLAARARQHVHEARPRFAVDQQRGHELAAGILSGLAERRPGGAEVHARRRCCVHRRRGRQASGRSAPIVSVDAVLALLAGLSRLFDRSPSRLVRYASINGLPGYVTVEADGLLQTTALDVREGRIAAVYVMRNPDKLQHLGDPKLH